MDLNLDAMTTETRNQATMDLDTMTPLEVVTAMNREDAKVPQAIHSQLPQIAQAVEWAIQSFKDGGRMFYMGAGTSGRLGVLEAAECPPTFGVSPNVVVGLIAGGEPAFTKAVEGAEDSREMGRGDLGVSWPNSPRPRRGSGCQRQDPLCAGRIGIRQAGGVPYSGYLLQRRFCHRTSCRFGY